MCAGIPEGCVEDAAEMQEGCRRNATGFIWDSPRIHGDPKGINEVARGMGKGCTKDAVEGQEDAEGIRGAGTELQRS